MRRHEWRSRYCGAVNASFQPANATSNLTWGFAPGYKITGLQPVTLDTIAAGLQRVLKKCFEKQKAYLSG